MVEIVKHSYSEVSINGGPAPTIHPTCVINGEWDIHPSVVIHPFTQLSGSGSIGEGTVIGSLCTLLGEVHIGKNCRIQSNCFIPGGTTIWDDVFMGPAVTILNDKYPPSHGESWRPVTIEEGVAVGGGVTILPGITLHKKCGIGGGALVTADVPEGYMAYNEYQSARIQKPRRFEAPDKL